VAKMFEKLAKMSIKMLKIVATALAKLFEKM